MHEEIKCTIAVLKSELPVLLLLVVNFFRSAPCKIASNIGSGWKGELGVNDTANCDEQPFETVLGTEYSCNPRPNFSVNTS